MRPYVLIVQPDKKLAFSLAAAVEALNLFPVLWPSGALALDLVEVWGSPQIALIDLSLPLLDLLSILPPLRHSIMPQRVPVLLVGSAGALTLSKQAVFQELSLDQALDPRAPARALHERILSLLGDVLLDSQPPPISASGHEPTAAL